MEDSNDSLMPKNGLESESIKEFRLWEFIEFTEQWHDSDTSKLDDISYIMLFRPFTLFKMAMGVLVGY